MKNTLNTSEVEYLLMSDENASWTMAGAYALAEYLEQVEEGCGTEIEFDRVAIRCEYSEYESLQEWARASTSWKIRMIAKRPSATTSETTAN
jgi:hypothetical protein